MQKSANAMGLFIASVIVLIGLMQQSEFPLPLIIALHALTFAVSASAGYLLREQIDSSGFSGIMLLMAYAGIGISISGIFFSIMPSAGILFSIQNIVVIVFVLNSA